MHNNIMAAGSKDRPPMLGPGRYSQWRSRFLRYIDTKPNGGGLKKSILSGPYMPTTVQVQAVEAAEGRPASQQKKCDKPLKEQQGESLNVQDVKTSVWKFGSLLLRDENPKKSSRFVMIVNNLKIDIVSYHRLFDILKQFQLEVNDIRAERIAKSANPLALIAAAQPYSDNYYQAPKPQTEQADWLEDTDEEIDEQELEAHYSYMALDSGESHLSSLIHNDTYVLEKDDSNVTSDSSNICTNDNQADQNVVECNEFEKYKAFNDRTIDYEILQTKLNETLGLLALKDIEIKEGLKTKSYEISVLDQKHDDLVKKSLLTKSQLEGYLKENTKVISDLKFQKKEVEDHHRISRISKKTKSVPAVMTVQIRTSNVTVYLNDVNTRTKKPNVVPISASKPKRKANKSVATPHKKTIVQLILFIVDSGCTKHMTGNLKLLCNFVEKFLGTVRFGNDQFDPILGYGESDSRKVLSNGLTTVKASIIIFLGCQICDADLRGCFRKSTWFCKRSSRETI
ncbi:hypothetical protein Tco_1246323 [Tanacetum coccineum]